MDYYLSQRLAQQLKNLDAAVARKDQIGIMIAAEAIDNLLRASPVGGQEPALPGCLPRWMQQVIRDQGLSIPALASAVSANKIVIRPTFGGSNFGLELVVRF